MNKIKFKNLCKKQYIILDGATGTELMKKGMPAGVCPELWMLENPSAIVEIQKEYIKAGSNIVLAPTFTANRIKLGEYGLENRQEEIIMELVSQSKKAVEGTDVLVAGDISMVGKQLYPMGDLALEELIDVYKEQINYLVKAGVDLLIVETMMSLAEMRAALIAAKDSCDLPDICSMTFEEDGRTLFGTDAKTASVVLESLGADVIGINCSTGPSKLKPFIEDMLNTVSIPVMAKPNAGLPKSDGKGGVCYDMAPEEFGREMAELIEMGVTFVGGCCGTSPLYIAELKKLLGGICFESPTTINCLPLYIEPMASCGKICDASSKTIVSKLTLVVDKNVLTLRGDIRKQGFRICTRSPISKRRERIDFCFLFFSASLKRIDTGLPETITSSAGRFSDRVDLICALLISNCKRSFSQKSLTSSSCFALENSEIIGLSKERILIQ